MIIDIETAALLDRLKGAAERHGDFTWAPIKPADLQATLRLIKRLADRIEHTKEHPFQCPSCQTTPEFALVAHVEMVEKRGDVRQHFAALATANDKD